MKKVIAGLLGFVLSLSFVVPSFAQNKPARYDASGIGQPNYTLNSGGSFYGQLFNSGSSSQWSLGFGSSQSTSGTGVINWNSLGHVFLGNTGAAPIVSSCGSNPSVASGSDMVGDLTLGSSGVATCTLTFAGAWTTVPHCFVQNKTNKSPVIGQPTASTLVAVPSNGPGGIVGTTNDVIEYLCIGHAS